jgi:ABC-type uncharacterized transport system substrate-binding protein
MRQTRAAVARVVLAGLITVGLSGCVSLGPEPEQPPEEQKSVRAAPSRPAAQPAPVVPEPAAPRVAVLISDDSPGYAEVAGQLTQALGAHPYRMINLYGKSEHADEAIAEAEAFGAEQLVAVGLLAATVARRNASMPAVFCQVFNYESHDLLGANMQGVSMLPPFSLQLTKWKAISPDLKRVGLIIGPGHADLISEAESAAATHGIELLIETVSSDKESLYVFKRMTTQIDGFWLLPDNRILSPAVIREIMSYGTRHGTQIVVFNKGLLALGALMSISSDKQDIATQVVRLLADPTGDASMHGSRPAPLTTLKVDVNRDALRELDLVKAVNATKLDSES